MQLNITVSGTKEIQKTLQNIDERIGSAIVKEATHELFDEVKKRAKKHTDTGNMEDNITFRVRKNNGIVYIEDAGMMVEYKGKKINYATFVLYGTRPHKIAPKEKETLRYSNVNRFVFAKTVKHPGYKGDNFLQTSRDAIFAKLDNIIDKVVTNAIK